MIKPRQNLSLANLAQYGFIALPVAFAGFPIYVHGPDYYASQFGLSLTLLAAILLALRFIDGIQDPIIGALCDRHARHRSTIILMAAALLTIGFWLLFHPLVQTGLSIWFAVTLFVVTTCYSVLVINVTALGGIWSTDHHERTRIAVMRESFGLLGLLLAVVLPSFLVIYYSATLAFTLVSLLLATLLLPGLILFLNWYFKHQNSLEATQPIAYQPNLIEALKSLSAETRQFYLIYGISMLASSMPAVLVIFFVRDYLQAPAYLGLFLTLYFLTGALGMVFWSWLSRFWNSKERVWMVAMLLAVISFCWVLVLNPGDLMAFGLICVASGLAFGAELSLPASILADHIANEDRRSESTFLYAQLTLLAKLSLAASTAIVFPLLDTAGFKPAETNNAAALLVLIVCYAGIPCLIKLISFALLYRQTSRRWIPQEKLKS